MTELRIPPMPATQARAMALLLKQDVVLTDLTSVIESDPVLTTAVIRASNSAISAPLDRVGAAGPAIIRLGINGVRQIVVAMILRDQTSAAGDSPIHLEELWRYLLATGLLADAFVWTRSGDDHERALAFTAGMLHKLGRLALAASQPKEYATVIEQVVEGRPELEAEQDVLGTDHVAHSVELCEDWSIPSEIADAIASQYGRGGGLIAEAVQHGRAITLALGYADGFGQLPPDSRATPELLDILVAHVGGTDQLAKRIEWYRGALPG